jgi:hypothetical protein
MSMTQQQGEALHNDVLANILSYLNWTEVMKCRVVSPEWRDAVLVTHVQGLDVDSRVIARAVTSLAAAIPCLQNLMLHDIPFRSEDDDDDDDDNVVNDELLASAEGFQQLRGLIMTEIQASPIRTMTEIQAFPIRTMQLHNLEKLDLDSCTFEWDLADLSGIPNLKKLTCSFNYNLKGDLSSLQCFSQTLAILRINGCSRVTGDLHTLASFTRLKSLELCFTRVTGDVRVIGLADFPCVMEKFSLGNDVYGGRTINRIVDAPEVMEAWCRFAIRNPGIWIDLLYLSDFSPDLQVHVFFPRYLVVVRCGPRCGWRWTNGEGHCEIHWINSEPLLDDNGYDEYVRDLADTTNGPISFYRGLLVPPSIEDYNIMLSELTEEHEYYPN